MTVELAIKKCVERIEKHITSVSPQIQIINCELSFLDKLSALAANGVELPSGEPVNENPSTPIDENVNFSEGTVLVFMKSGRGAVEAESKMLYMLNQDSDWKSENYRVSLTDDPEETYNSHWRKVNASRTSKYTLHTGEIAYLIKI